MPGKPVRGHELETRVAAPCASRGHATPTEPTPLRPHDAMPTRHGGLPQRELQPSQRHPQVRVLSCSSASSTSMIISRMSSAPLPYSSAKIGKRIKPVGETLPSTYSPTNGASRKRPTAGTMRRAGRGCTAVGTPPDRREPGLGPDRASVWRRPTEVRHTVAREHLADLIVQAHKAGMKQGEEVALSGYTRGAQPRRSMRACSTSSG
jgi:hypothetical protein